MKTIIPLAVWMVMATFAGGVGCDSNTGVGGSGGGGAGGGQGFHQPPGTVAVGFTVDDTANKVFGAGELQWKAAFVYDVVTRTAVADPAWTGPFPLLFDDGPWNASSAGHEPAGAIAGDHVFGATVFVKPSATGKDTYEYGLVDATNNVWMWRGATGTFDVAAGATEPVNLAVVTLPGFGASDIKLVADAALLAGAQGLSTLLVVGSAWGWERWRQPASPPTRSLRAARSRRSRSPSRWPSTR